MADKSKSAKLEHSQGGVTTRDDPLDQGPPMLAGDPSEPVGPEDALGPGKKRGDYSEVMTLRNPHTSEPIPYSERERDDDGNVVGPHTRLVAQKPRASEQGEEKGKKGGVQTS